MIICIWDRKHIAGTNINEIYLNVVVNFYFVAVPQRSFFTDQYNTKVNDCK
jgi:hypothetical protein